MNAVDTNILLYACDRSDLRKNAIAKHVIRQTQGGPLLWQVAVEFIAACRRLEYRGFTSTMAWSRLHQFSRVYRLIVPTHDCLTRARHLHIDNDYSFWDALVVAPVSMPASRVYIPRTFPVERRRRVSKSSIPSPEQRRWTRDFRSIAVFRAWRKTIHVPRKNLSDEIKIRDAYYGINKRGVCRIQQSEGASLVADAAGRHVPPTALDVSRCRRRSCHGRYSHGQRAACSCSHGLDLLE